MRPSFGGPVYLGGRRGSVPVPCITKQDLLSIFDGLARSLCFQNLVPYMITAAYMAIAKN